MISIVIPIYKVEKYISKCIKSVINQSVKSFELILVDDGTPDKSVQIAEKMISESWIENYQIIHTENRGVSAARNIGLSMAKGDFVIMVDADDVLSTCFIEDMIRISKKIPDCNIYSMGYSIVDVNKADYFDESKENHSISIYTADESISVFRSRRVKFLLPTLMFRKKYLDIHEILFDEKVRYSEDVQFIWRALFYNDKNIVHLNKVNYNYVLHGNSTMTASGINKILTGFDGLQTLYKECKNVVDKEMLEIIVSQMCFSLLHSAAKMLNFREFKVLYNRSECSKKLKKMNDSDYRYKLITAIMRRNLRIGYYIMYFL